MEMNISTHRVEVRFVGAPPARQIERASGVGEVEIAGSVVRCLVAGSFQSFLEALRGHEVVTLQSTQAVELLGPKSLSTPRVEGDL
jgi:hypothetical protein